MTVLVLCFLAALALALGLAWSARRSAIAAREELYDLRFQMRERFSELEKELAGQARTIRTLRAELRRQAGNSFTADMTVAEAIARHPGAAQVLAAFELGGRGSCVAGDTLARAAEARQVDLDQLLDGLNLLLDPNADPESIPRPAPKLIQIQ